MFCISAANGPILISLSCLEAYLPLNLKGSAQFCKNLKISPLSRISLISKVPVVFIATLCKEPDAIRAKWHAWNRSIVVLCYIIICIEPLTGGHSKVQDPLEQRRGSGTEQYGTKVQDHRSDQQVASGESR